MEGRKLFISIMIVLIVGLHILPVLQELHGNRQTFWPIMAWGMYRKSYDPDRSLKTLVRRIIGVTLQNDIIEVTAFDAGLGDFGFHRLFVRPMLIGDSFAARRLADLVNRELNDLIVELRVQTETFTIIDTGISRETSSIMTYHIGN
jgi:hypothetical protein